MSIEQLRLATLIRHVIQVSILGYMRAARSREASGQGRPARARARLPGWTEFATISPVPGSIPMIFPPKRSAAVR